MSQENASDQSYRFGYVVCAIFLIAYTLVTWAVVSDALHRAQLEEVVAQAVGSAAMMRSARCSFLLSERIHQERDSDQEHKKRQELSSSEWTG
jgi:E3 ubiquitin-protein ligase DOA10